MAAGEADLEGKPVILVIEDDPLIWVFAEALGFEPALAFLLKDGNAKYRALVTDINLIGRIDGWEVAQRAREIDPAAGQRR
jgi:hypothetical protein